MFMKRIFNSKKLWSFKIVYAHCLLKFIALQKFKMEMKTLAIYSTASPYFRPTSTRLSHDAHRNIKNIHFGKGLLGNMALIILFYKYQKLVLLSRILFDGLTYCIEGQIILIKLIYVLKTKSKHKCISTSHDCQKPVFSISSTYFRPRLGLIQKPVI